MNMNNKIYDILKWVAIIVLPAASTFVASVFPLWDLPFADAIAQTITACGAFLGAVLMVSNLNYKNGDNAGATGPQGPTGPMGPQGIQGPAYTLNEDDKNTIANAVLALMNNAGDENGDK